MLIDPQQDLNGFIEQWEKAQKQYQADYSQLIAMIGTMLELAKSGKIGEAFQMGQMVVMPGAMQVQGDSMAELAGAMNISSALEEFTTAAQNDLSGGANMTDGQAQDFVKYLKQFYDEITMSPPPPWLDKNTQTNLIAAITKICESFGHEGSPPPTNPGQLDWHYVQSCIKNWSQDPSKVINGETGQQRLQNLQSAFTQWNNTESAQSQVLQSQEQFASNVFNQYMNTVTDIFQASQRQVQSMVQNQKSQ